MGLWRFGRARTRSGSSVEKLTEIPGDRTAAKFAYSASGLGVLGVATLGIMYAVEVPRNGPYIFGTINDATGGVFNLAVIPVIIQVHRRLPKTPTVSAGKWVVVAACAAGSASSFLLVFKRLDFETSTAVSIGSIAVQGAWFLLAHQSLLKAHGYPRNLAHLGRGIGAALLAALPLAGFAFAEQVPGWLRWGVGGAGAALGACAWVAWPYWYYLAGRHLDQSAAG